MSDSDNKRETAAQKSGQREALRTREVFLDTEAYRRFGFNQEKPSLQALLSHVEGDRLQLHMTDITLREIERQIAGVAHKAVEDISRARALTAKWRKRAPKALGKPAKLPKPIDAEAVASETFERFQCALRPYLMHRATQEGAEEIFRDYFARKPPFDGEGGKSVKEFPDAFVIAALDRWAYEQNTLLYVITNDMAFLRAAATRQNLIPIETVDELLEIATVEHNPDVISTIEIVIEQPEFEEQLARAVEGVLDDLAVYYAGDLFDGEASDPASSGEPKLFDWVVISAADDVFGLIVEFEIDLLFQVHYEDVSMASYDREDGIYLGAEPAVAEVEETVTLRMFIQVHESGSITRAELLTGTVTIYGPHEE